METLYSGVQTAQVIAASPMTAPLADGLAKSVGFVDQNQAPIYPQATEAMPALDMPQNTNPLTPANPAGASVGMQEGIETPELD